MHPSRRLLMGTCLLAIVPMFASQQKLDPVLQARLDDVFGQSPLVEPAAGCVCVPYYLCVNSTILEDGVGIIDVRFQSAPDTVDEDTPCTIAARGSCKESIQVWCTTPDVLPEPPTPGPDPQPIIDTEHPVVKAKDLPGCGHRNIQGVGFRIVGDVEHEAQFGEFPWMVAILVIDEHNANIYHCGGSLIHPQVVLTAAHCVINMKNKRILARAGEWDTQTEQELLRHQNRHVKKMIKHERFYSGGLHNDIALMVLESPFTLDEHINTVCLPEQGVTFDHKRCTATGWGKSTYGKEGLYQVILKSITLPIVPRDTCQKNLRSTRLGQYFKLHESFMCAGGEIGKDTCKGDGGGPLVCPVDGFGVVNEQVGIVAWGIDCGAENTPGVYADVAHLRGWVDEKMVQNGFNTDSYRRQTHVDEVKVDMYARIA